MVYHVTFPLLVFHLYNYHLFALFKLLSVKKSLIIDLRRGFQMKVDDGKKAEEYKKEIIFMVIFY